MPYDEGCLVFFALKGMLVLEKGWNSECLTLECKEKSEICEGGLKCTALVESLTTWNPAEESLEPILAGLKARKRKNDTEDQGGRTSGGTAR